MVDEAFVPLYRNAMEGFSMESKESSKLALTDSFQIHLSLARALEVAIQANGLIEITAPFKLAKDPAQSALLDAVLYTLAESLRVLAILLSPVLPKSAHEIFDQLQWKVDESGKESRFSLADAQWGGLPDGHVVGKPVPLFPRIEEAKA